MRHALRISLPFLALTALTAPAGAGDGFRVESVGEHQGLAEGIVTTVFVDRHGLLWAPTREGLLSFDGYATRVFSHDPSDPGSISDNIVRSICEDRAGRLWIGTHSGGLNLFDRASGTFIRYRHDPDDPASIGHDTVTALAEDRDGRLWVGTQIGLNRLDPEAGTFERLMADPEDSRRPSHDEITALLADSRDEIWIGTNGGGLNRYDPATGILTRFTSDPEDPSSLDSNSVYALAEDEQGAVWIGTALGVSRLARNGAAFRRYAAEFDAHGGPLEVAGLAAVGPASLWIGTVAGDLFRLNTLTGELRSSRESAPEGEPARRILALHATSDALYIATWGGGLKRVRFDATPLSAVFPEIGYAGGTHVASVLEDREGTLWIGIYDGPLHSRSRDEDQSRAREVPGRQTFAFAEGEGDELWYGADSGLGRIDRRTGEVTFFRHDPEDPRSIGRGFVSAVLRDSEGRVWAGTSESGLQRLREDGRTFDRFPNDPDDPSSPSDDYVTRLFEDSAGTLWVGTRLRGLNACDRKTVRCERYLPNPEDPRSLSFQHVSAILEDRAGTLSIGTAGGGLNRLEEDGFHHVRSADGLISDGIMGMVEDDDGSLWISTRAGLTRYDPEQGRTLNLGVGDGLPAAGLAAGSAARGRERIYFGGTEGLVSLPAGTPFPEAPPSPTVFTSIEALRGTLQLDRGLAEVEQLELRHGEVLAFQFAVLDYDLENRHRYAYRLGDAAEAWIDLAGRRDLIFNDLKPGRYTLSVKGRNARGVWSERVLRLTVVPPFWMTWWFRLSALAVVLLILGMAYSLRVSALERRNRELLRLNEEKRLLARSLEAAEENERKRIARELHDEMGQVLSAAKITLQTLSAAPDDAARDRQLADVVGQMDHMLSHVRSLSLDLSPPFLDEVGLSLALQGYLEAVSKRSGVEIRVEAEPGVEELEREERIHVFRVVQESITNVIRHSGAREAVVTMRSLEGHLEVAVRDRGRGFDPGDALRRSLRGQHLGLLGMRERASSLGAELTIDSRRGSGTEIRIRVPLGR